MNKEELIAHKEQLFREEMYYFIDNATDAAQFMIVNEHGENETCFSLDDFRDSETGVTNWKAALAAMKAEAKRLTDFITDHFEDGELGTAMAIGFSEVNLTWHFGKKFPTYITIKRPAILN